MGEVMLLVPSIILPTVWELGTETEAIDDLVEHTSVEFPIEYLQEKIVYITATEVAIAAVAAGNLWCWVEISPLPTANSLYWPVGLPVTGAYWAAIGGGGGAIAPTAPLIEVSGLGGAIGALTHGITLPWAIHQTWARVVVQTPVAANLPNASWVVQVSVAGKTP